MSKIFHAVACSLPTQLKRIACTDETKDLQDRLALQPELLAGDQIRPEDPRRWLMIRREMPVNSPTTATQNFSLDFLYVDQDGIPTLVEAKRCGNPEARREVVGQMLEYAANGRAYWNKDDLEQAFVHTCGDKPDEALARLKAFRGGGEESLASFFEEVLVKLRSGVMRLIFFLEDSSYELRSIAEFLNQEFETIEVFVVEARQYRLDGSAGDNSTIIVPHVVGFSEAVRLSKQRTREGLERVSYEKGEEPFWKNLTATLPPDQVQSIRRFVDDLHRTNGWGVRWLLSCIFLHTALLAKRGLFAIRRSGELELYLGYWQRNYSDVTDLQVAARDKLLVGLKEMGFAIDAQKQAGFPLLQPAQWIPKAENLLKLVKGLQCPAPSSSPDLKGAQPVDADQEKPMGGWEVIVEVGGEGGSITLLGRRTADGKMQFRLYTNEAIFDDDEDYPVGETSQTPPEHADTFSGAAVLLDRYRWAGLYPKVVHPDYLEQTLQEVRKRGGTSEELRWRESLSQG